MTMFTIIKTIWAIVLALRSMITSLTIFLAPQHFILTLIGMMTLFTIPITFYGSESSSPIYLLPIRNLMFPFIRWGIVRFPTVLMLFSPLLIQTLVMSRMKLAIFFINSTTVYQIHKTMYLLISNYPFDFQM